MLYLGGHEGFILVNFFCGVEKLQQEKKNSDFSISLSVTVVFMVGCEGPAWITVLFRKKDGKEGRKIILFCPS